MARSIGLIGAGKHLRLIVGLGAAILAACGKPGVVDPSPFAASSPMQTALSNHDGGAESDGLKAEITSPISVLLSWTPIDGATAYRIEASAAGGEWFQVANPDPEVTSFEVVPVPDELEVAFRLTAIMQDGSSPSREVSVTTPAQAPNPYAVQITLEESRGSLPGFDASTFDPATFDPSALDPSLFLTEGFDPSDLIPAPLTATQEIGPEGGVLEVTSSSGTTYTLTIPEGAMPYTVDVSITPIVSLDGLPEGVELIGAVQIEPSGLELAAPTTLTIAWPQPLAIGDDLMLVGVGFDQSGSDFHFMPIAGEDPGVSIAPPGSISKLASLVSRQTTAGNGGVSSSKLQSQGSVRASPNAVIEHARNYPAVDRASQAEANLAASKAKGGSSGYAELAAGSIEERAGKSYADLAQALVEWEKLLKEAGTELDPDKIDEVWEQLIDALYKKLNEAVAGSCLSNQHLFGLVLSRRVTRPVSAYDKELTRRFIEKYGNDGKELIKKAGQLEERCELVLYLESNIEMYYDANVTCPGCTTIAKIKTKEPDEDGLNGVPLTWAGVDWATQRPYLSGRGQVQYVSLRYNQDECRLEPNKITGSVLIVKRLIVEVSELPAAGQAGSNSPSPELRDFELRQYVVQGKASQFRATGSDDCERSWGLTRAGTFDHWWTVYGLAMHTQYVLRDWQISANIGTSTIATKLINHSGRTVPLGGISGTVSGQTRFWIRNFANQP